MAIITSGRVIRAKGKETLLNERSRRAPQWDSLRYNHVRAQFSDGSDRHFLLTDKKFLKARDRANKMKLKSKISWVKEVWYDGLIEVGPNEVKDDISNLGLPSLAKRFNHLRLNIEGKELHLLFTDKEIRNALSLSEESNDKLPKVSWVSRSLVE